MALIVVSISNYHAVGRGFTSRACHTRDHHKNGTNSLLAWYAYVKVGLRDGNLTV